MRWQKRGGEEIDLAKVQGGDRECQVAKTQEQPSGATPRLRLGPAARAGQRRFEMSHFTFKVRRGSCEEIPPVQGKEQWLHFAGAAVKRYPTSKVSEIQVRW